MSQALLLVGNKVLSLSLLGCGCLWAVLGRSSETLLVFSAWTTQSIGEMRKSARVLPAGASTLRDQPSGQAYHCPNQPVPKPQQLVPEFSLQSITCSTCYHLIFCFLPQRAHQGSVPWITKCIILSSGIACPLLCSGLLGFVSFGI